MRTHTEIQRTFAFITRVLLASACFVSGSARAELVEQELRLPVHVVDGYGKGISHPIVLTVFYDDATPAPRPAIVLNHGRDTTPEGRSEMARARFPAASKWFASQGFLVVAPTRIGYGVTGGEDIEDAGSCANKRFAPGFAAAATEVEATLDWLRARPDVQVDRLVLLGQSFGGGTTVAVAARNPAGVVVAINFAGGSGGDPKEHPRSPCAPQRMRIFYEELGTTAKVPMLWAYTENDKFWGPTIPKDWFEAFTAHGAPAEFHHFDAKGEDGHLLFSRFPDIWRPVVADYLRRHGFDIKE